MRKERVLKLALSTCAVLAMLVTNICHSQNMNLSTNTTLKDLMLMENCQTELVDDYDPKKCQVTTGDSLVVVIRSTYTN